MNSKRVLSFISLFAMYGMFVVAELPHTINALCIKWGLRCSPFFLAQVHIGTEHLFHWAGCNKGGNRIQSAHYLYYTHRTRNARGPSLQPPPPPPSPSRTISYEKMERVRRIDKFHAQSNPFAIKVSLCGCARVCVCVSRMKYAPSQKHAKIFYHKT